MCHTRERFCRILPFIILLGIVTIPVLPIAAQSQEVPASPPHLVWPGELVNFPPPWSFMLHKPHIILVSDEQLEALSDPDARVDLSLTFEKREQSLREVCEQAQAAGHHTLILAFDHFFSQYRPGQHGKPRRLTPDKPEYVERIARISDFAAQYGLGLELSLLSPLEIGPGYVEETGESGIWMQYRKGPRDPETGRFSVEFWRQTRWANNKGPLDIADGGVRVFAFRERRIPGTSFRVVDPADIVELTGGVEVETVEGMRQRSGDYEAVRVRVYGSGHPEAGPRNRVLVVQMYRVPEMDYFSDQALPYLKRLCDRYVDAGVKLHGLYSDEMHIQQDWGYFSHHDHGEFALRYVSPGLARKFSERYGAEYADFARYLLYFCQGQEDWSNDLTAREDVSHVFGDSPEAIRQTALFRARYYRMLQDGVVDLLTEAKHYLDSRVGYRLEARAHATWAESPTCDRWNTFGLPENQFKYEYTPNFVWSNTVHQAASACYDYFKWGEFLTGNGNDHAEGGWLDRNYVGLALACSTGILNDVPYSYGAHWGMPGEISRRRSALVNAFGASAWPPFATVQDMEHRDTDVLMLYPLDLVAMDARFGSWMSQYAYANLITAAKLVERGKVMDGFVDVAGRRFGTIVVQFEPFPSRALLDLLSDFARHGGRVLWSGPPPLLRDDGSPALDTWRDLFGVEYAPGPYEGLPAPGQEITFEGPLEGLPPMTILTDFVVDRVYPVAPREGSAPVARLRDNTVIGTVRQVPEKGLVAFLGFRPRDDQAASLGYETRYWFDILCRMGAYPPTGRFEGINDNPDFVSRTGPYMVCRFPNGAVTVAPHLARLKENWPGGFARKAEEDNAIVQALNLPENRLDLRQFHAAGHVIDFSGIDAMAFRLDETNRLIAFAGSDCDRITVDGQETVFADRKMSFVSWAPVASARRVPNGAVMTLFAKGEGRVSVPAVPELDHGARAWIEGVIPGSRGTELPVTVENRVLRVDLPAAASGRWVYLTPAQASAP